MALMKFRISKTCYSLVCQKKYWDSVGQNFPKMENEKSLAPMSVLYLSIYLYSRAHMCISQGPLHKKVSQSNSCGHSKLLSQDAWKDAKN